MNGNSGISDFQSSASPQSPGRSHTRRRGNSLAVPEPSSSGQRGANVEEDFNEDHFGPEQNNTGEEGSSAIGSAISFKRRKNPPPSRYTLFSADSPTGSNANLSSPQPAAWSPYVGSRISYDETGAATRADRNGHSGSPPIGHGHGHGDGDWVENQGRRVYDDLTAIDWIYEYTKERARKRRLKEKGGGIPGLVRSIWDDSQIWLVLVGTGLSAGLVAGMIDIVSLWLGDVKEGICETQFYLSKAFCCWGIDEKYKCDDWDAWNEIFGATSKGGSYILNYFVYVFYSVLFAFSAAVLVKHYAVYARHSGIPEIKTLLGGFVIRRFLGAWTLLTKSIGLCLSVASGLWLGKEGPLVHVACCCANILMKPFAVLRQNEARKREVLSAAASAGISVAFGSPIGGVLFSLEQLSYYFPDKTMWQSFVCAMVAAVSLQFFNPFRTGKLVLYQVQYTRGWHDFEMVPYALLGILGGLYGAFFIKLNMYVATWRKSSWFRYFPILEVVLVALVTALMNFPVSYMRLQSSELVAYLFQECSNAPDPLGLCKDKAAQPISLLLLSAGIGIVMASITFGLQLPAGVILPSMAIGALYGRAIGITVQSWQASWPDAWFFSSCQPDVQCVTPGVYAIVGAASALAGVTRMTVSIVVIMFELTGVLTYVLPIMIAVMISKWVGDAFGTRGIYESWIHFKEYPYLENKDEYVPDILASKIMTRIEDLVVITATGNSINSLEQLLQTQPYKGFPVVTNTREAHLLGYISRSELRQSLTNATEIKHLPPHTECIFSTTSSYSADPPTVYPSTGSVLDLRPWLDQTPITLPSKSSLLLTTNLFAKLGLRYILFATHGQLEGLLTKKDVAFALSNEGLEDEYQDDLEGAGVTTRWEEEGGGVGRRLLDLDGDMTPDTASAVGIEDTREDGMRGL